MCGAMRNTLLGADWEEIGGEWKEEEKVGWNQDRGTSAPITIAEFLT
jgi:hypothetical protein